MEKSAKKPKKTFNWLLNGFKTFGATFEPIISIAIAVIALFVAIKSNRIALSAEKIAKNSNQIAFSTDSLTRLAVSLARNDSIQQANDSTQFSILKEQQKLYETSQLQLKELMDVSENIYFQVTRMKKEDEIYLRADSVRFFQSLKSVYDSLEYFTQHVPHDSIVTTEHFKDRIKNLVGRCLLILHTEVSNRYLLLNRTPLNIYNLINEYLDDINIKLHYYVDFSDYPHENFYFFDKLEGFGNILTLLDSGECRVNLEDCFKRFQEELENYKKIGF